MTKISNNTTFQKYYNQFTLLALNMFEWENLPDGIETRHIEKPLIEFGYSFFYNDENFGYVCLPCTITGFNIYNEPTRITINNQIIHKTMNISTLFQPVGDVALSGIPPRRFPPFLAYR